MDVRYTVGQDEYKRMTTQELRDGFLIDVFAPGAINLPLRLRHRGLHVLLGHGR